MKKVFILAGESSGELYGSLLARALRARWGDVRIFGVGGQRMREEGVELVAEVSGAFGLVELLSSLKKIKETFSTVVSAIRRERPDVIVLIDFPDFNIGVAREISDSGIPILYYVSPQVWAWRGKRVHTIARISDCVAVILPFEPELYEGTGARCEFVGHPILEEFASLPADKQSVKRDLGLSGESPVLALLPGSRDSELSRLLPVMRGVADQFRARRPEFQLVMPVAPNVKREKHSGPLGELADRGVRLIDGDAVRVLAASDIGVVASGTAALQAAFVGIPLVVIYRLFPLTYFLGKMIVRVKYINLVNIMCDEMVITELLQKEARPGRIVEELQRILSDDAHRQRMLERFREVRSRFEGRHASERVSAIVGELAGW